jgi:hypothetical protein
MTSENTDLAKLLAITDVAIALRNQSEEGQTTFSADEQKLDLKDRILKMSEKTGEKLSEEDAFTAVDNYMNNAHSFRTPQRNTGYKLASMFTERIKILKHYVAPVLAVGVVATLTWGGINYGAKLSAEKAEKNKIAQEAREKQDKIDQEKRAKQAKLDHEAKIELAVENLYSRKQNLTERTNFLSTLKGDYTNFNEMIVVSNLELDSTDPFFAKFCSDGTATDDVTQDNVQKAELEMNSAKASLDKVANVVSAGNSVIQAEKFYKAGKDIAEEQLAIDKLDGIYLNVQSAARSINATQLENQANQLNRIHELLSQELTYKIVTKTGVKSGIDRYYTDSRGRRASGVYLIIEASNSNGRIVPQDITSEETNRTSTVSMWGDRVPNATYEAVKRDKMDNGRIENNVYAIKARGYITPQVKMKGRDGQPLRREGQITKW